MDKNTEGKAFSQRLTKKKNRRKRDVFSEGVYLCGESMKLLKWFPSFRCVDLKKIMKHVWGFYASAIFCPRHLELHSLVAGYFLRQTEIFFKIKYMKIKIYINQLH